MKGYIRHNDKLRLIKFKETLNDNEELSFLEERVVKMEYYDRERSNQRTFLHLSMENEAGSQVATLFEVILELREFALLSKKFGVNPAVREWRDDNGVTHQNKVGYEQFEKLYFVGIDGVVELVLVTVDFERDKENPLAFPARTFYDQSVLKKFVSAKWDLIRDYMKDNHLNPKRRSDFMAILTYYQKLDEGK